MTVPIGESDRSSLSRGDSLSDEGHCNAMKRWKPDRAPAGIARRTLNFLDYHCIYHSEMRRKKGRDSSPPWSSTSV